MNRLVLLLLIISVSTFAQVELDLQKFRIFPSPGGLTQTEPIAVFHPSDNSFIFASAVTLNISTSFKSEGIYISTDGGFTWTGNDTCKGASIYNHGGDPGVVITENNRLILSHIALSPLTGVYSNYSDDFGETWTSNNTITNNYTGDKGTITADHFSQSNFNGRIYLAWTEVSTTSPAVSSFSSDNGQSWSSPVIVNPNPPLRCVGGSVATSNSGRVYVAWSGISSSSPFHEIVAGLAISIDGGVSWSNQQNIFGMNGIAGLLPQKNNIKVNGLPQIAIDNSGGSRNGWIYIITTEKNNPPAGSDPDIVLHRSTDNGISWSNGIRVNQDAVDNGKIQYFPFLDVDVFGNLNVLFYDDRYTSSDSASVFIARSNDGGNNWIEYSIKNTTFKPKPIAGGASGYQGDHISLISNDYQLNAFWMADYSGVYQVWSVVIDRSILDVDPQTENKPVNFYLYQNFPNPFNPSTSIKFVLREGSFVTLKIFDLLGREARTLFADYQSAGEHEINFESDGLPAGIYFYTLRAGKFQQTKKLVLLK